jgi:outer membrane lipoprotein-sorting protein
MHTPLSNTVRITLALVAMACGAIGATSQTAEGLVAKNIAAKGGLANIKAITSIRTAGKLETQGIVLQVGSDQKPDFLVRRWVTVQNLTQVRAYDGTEGWMIDPFQGRRDPERMGEEDTRDLSERYDFYGPLVDYQQKGSKVEYVGHASVDGDDALLLKVSLKNGDVINYFLDPDTCLEIRAERMMFVRGKVRETFSNLGSYKKVNGVYFPFSIEQGSPGNPANDSKITISKIEVNIPMPDSEFKMPGGPSTPAGSPLGSPPSAQSASGGSVEREAVSAK